VMARHTRLGHVSLAPAQPAEVASIASRKLGTGGQECKEAALKPFIGTLRVESPFSRA
jgi:hypothetical protein